MVRYAFQQWENGSITPVRDFNLQKDETLIAYYQVIEVVPVHVDTEPFPETVYIDGVPAGYAPVDMEVSIGPHTITFGSRPKWKTPDPIPFTAQSGDIFDFSPPDYGVYVEGGYDWTLPLVAVVGLVVTAKLLGDKKK